MTEPSSKLAILIGSYNSHPTVEKCLTHLRQQSKQDFQVYMFDSSPSAETERIVQQFPEVVLVRSQQKTTSHIGRNYLVEHYPHAFYLCLDPDVYAEPDMIDQLMALHQAHPQAAIQGSIGCYGNRWLDWGIHFCKFGTFLPYRPAVLYRGAATACFAFTHEQWLATGGFENKEQADYIFALQLLDKGFEVLSHPNIIVYHHHLDSLGTFWKSRLQRGAMMGASRLKQEAWSVRRVWLWWFLSAFMIRLPIVCLRFGIHAARAGYFWRYLWALPIVILGFASWIQGEANAYRDYLKGIPQ